jgi:hypothetical protein
MPRLPVLHKRRSKKQQALDLTKRAAKVGAAVKVSTAGARVAKKGAKKGAKTYGAVKGAKLAGRPVVKVAAIPVTVAGGVVVWRKLKSGSSNGDVARPLGPVASADAVSPPADAAVQTAGSDA